ncbi:hypothetical protein SK355_14425 [Candidatus Fukatsuia symbiotica]|uniref:hypothetical protein n=1 Tax=Candidatus Fukatsuia TaxID=1927833 RepID=UPI0013C33E8B|nr:hypothetical protein [Candidatus Fukatsuia symbiotica]MEA9446332.1 hypothetical protein [Candidatus Fukatsuia symbiotica]
MKKINIFLKILLILLLPTSVWASATDNFISCKIQWKHKYMGISPVPVCTEQQAPTQKAMLSDTEMSSSVSINEKLRREELRRLRKITLFL